MQFYQLSQTSLAKSGSSVVEEYIPLWMADGTIASTTHSGSYFYLTDGATSPVNTAGSNTYLYTLNSSWNSNQKFAFEASIYTTNSASTASFILWDFTSATSIGSSSISTTSTTATVVRSGQFTLTPGHVYGVGIASANSSYSAVISDASLIVFGQ